MTVRVLLALSLVGVGCDDTVFPPPEGVYEADWLSVQAFCFNNCRQCHPSLADPSWPEALEDDLIDGDEIYVVPGNPDASMFWRVLTPDDRLDSDPPRMPLGRPLDPDTVEFVREWILAGAPL